MPTKRGPYAKSAQRRDDIANAAFEIVSDEGYRAVTNAEVARRAGVAERSVSYHFPSREHLLVAALEASERATRGAFVDQPDLETSLGNVARFEVEHLNVLKLRAALNAEASDPDHPAHAYAVRHYAAATAGLASLVRSHQERGDYHPDLDPDATARRLVALWEGLQARWLVDRDFDLADELTQTVRHLSGRAAMEAKRAIDSLMVSP